MYYQRQLGIVMARSHVIPYAVQHNRNKTDFKSTMDIPNWAPGERRMGGCDVYCEHLGENWLCYNKNRLPVTYDATTPKTKSNRM